MKIEEQVLSREQMAHLKELGIDTSDASMMWYRCDDGNAERWYLQINNELSNSLARIMKGTVGCLVPTYTIGDLIGKLPKYIGGHELFIELGRKCGYRRISDKKYVFAFNSHLEGLYKLVCWVAENCKELIK